MTRAKKPCRINICQSKFVAISLRLDFLEIEWSLTTSIECGAEC